MDSQYKLKSMYGRLVVYDTEKPKLHMLYGVPSVDNIANRHQCSQVVVQF